MINERTQGDEPFIYLAADEAATERLGAALALHLRPGTTVALSGTLGAGKTRLVQAIAVGCGIPRSEVLSPTFVLGQHYHGQHTLHHFDIYRLRDEDEFIELGPEEYFESDGITLVEWADRFPQVLPEDHLEIEIRVQGQTSREFLIRGTGKKSGELQRILAESLATV